MERRDYPAGGFNSTISMPYSRCPGQGILKAIGVGPDRFGAYPFLQYT